MIAYKWMITLIRNYGTTYCTEQFNDHRLSFEIMLKDFTLLVTEVVFVPDLVAHSHRNFQKSYQ